MAMNIIFNRSRPLLLKTLNPIFFKPISTSSFLSQQSQQLISDPPNPISQENRINPSGSTQSLIPLEFLQSRVERLRIMAHTLDLEGIKELFADWMTLKKWDDMKFVFDVWIESYDKNGKLNQPDLDLFNHILRALLMMNETPSKMLQWIQNVQGLGLMKVNTASYNLVLKAMREQRKVDDAVKLLDWMIMLKKDDDPKPDEESFELVVGMLLPLNPAYAMNPIFRKNQIRHTETAYKYIDLYLKSGYRMSQDAFNRCVWNFMNFGSLDTLVSVIERCKKMDQNKALTVDWKMCLEVLDHAMKADNSELAYCALEFMAKLMVKDEEMRPPRYLIVEEGLVVSLLATAGRTYSKKLLNGAWSILKRSLRQKVASAETYIARIHALASLRPVNKAMEALFEFESLYGGSDKQAEDLFSPFTTLYPLVVACSHNSYASLDSVYYKLEDWSKENPPRKSVAALNCIILGCANIWDAERASLTFKAISTTFGLTPDINSYNGLICAYGKLKQVRSYLPLTCCLSPLLVCI
ncbi:hypothetical protein AgCh_028690 [Apium graveolens]